MKRKKIIIWIFLYLNVTKIREFCSYSLRVLAWDSRLVSFLILKWFQSKNSRNFDLESSLKFAFGYGEIMCCSQSMALASSILKRTFCSSPVSVNLKKMKKSEIEIKNKTNILLKVCCWGAIDWFKPANPCTVGSKAWGAAKELFFELKCC